MGAWFEWCFTPTRSPPTRRSPVPRGACARQALPFCSRAAAEFDRSRDVPRHRRCQLHKLAARPLQREAMLVIPARRIRPQCSHIAPVHDLQRLRAPLFGRAVALRRHPPFDVPAIMRRILRLAPHLDHFAQERPRSGIAVFPLPANPVQPRPAPHRAVVWLAVRIAAASERQLARHVRGRVMRFAQNVNHREA
jgi:hypothetical protein